MAGGWAGCRRRAGSCCCAGEPAGEGEHEHDRAGTGRASMHSPSSVFQNGVPDGEPGEGAAVVVATPT